MCIRDSTKDTIVVEFLGKGKEIISSVTKEGKDINCSWSGRDASWGLPFVAHDALVGFRVRTTGHDAFMIDHLELLSEQWQGQGRKYPVDVTGAGDDGGTGKCLSTQKSDADAWKGYTKDCKESRLYRLTRRSW